MNNGDWNMPSNVDIGINWKDKWIYGSCNKQSLPQNHPNHIVLWDNLLHTVKFNLLMQTLNVSYAFHIFYIQGSILSNFLVKVSDSPMIVIWC